MKIGFIMDADYLFGYPEDSALLTQWLVKTSPHRPLYVVDYAQYLRGVVRLEDASSYTGSTLQDIMMPACDVFAVSPDDEVDGVLQLFRTNLGWSSIPVVADGRLVGIVPREWAPTPIQDGDEDWRTISAEQFQQHVLDALYTGLMIVDHRGITRLLNPAGAEILGVDPGQVVDKGSRQQNASQPRQKRKIMAMRLGF